jgi:SAM-dependent methyltransferase
MDRELEHIWLMNRDQMVQRLETIVKDCPNHGLSLHLGCGPHHLAGFINADKYYDHPRVVKWDMYQIPLVDGIVSTIYSSHALEHLPFHRAKLALVEWGRVLKQGGRVFLAIPDLEVICQKMLDPEIPVEVRHSWYHYTLFGYQIDPNTLKQPNNLNLSDVSDFPLDEGQFHRCGFTEETIQYFLRQAGFDIAEIFKYDGYSTPSIWVSAVKV